MFFSQSTTRLEVPIWFALFKKLCGESAKLLYGTSAKCQRSCLNLVLKCAKGMSVCMRNSSLVFCAVYVDDHIFAGTTANCNYFCNKVDAVIKLDDRGYLSENDNTILGMSCTQAKDGSICLSQQGYVRRLLAKYNSDNMPCQSPTSMVPWRPEEWHAVDSPKIDRTKYLEGVGSVIYLSCSTRPDISYCVGVLPCFLQDPGEIHWQAFLRLLRYLKKTVSLSLTFCRNHTAQVMECYSNADFGGTRSTHGLKYIYLRTSSYQS